MAFRPIFRDVCHFRVPYMQLPKEKSIKTDSSQRKGKVTIIKRKFVADEKSFEVLEVKDSSSVIKRLNWENNHLFGNIVSAAQRCYYKTYNSFAGQSVPKHVPKPGKKSPAMVDEDSAIPIKNVKTFPNLVSSTTSASASNSIYSKDEVLSLILDFPLSNIISEREKNEDYVNKLNCLRQHLSTLCKSGSFPSVTTVLEKTMPPERTAALERWKSDMINKMGVEKFNEYQQEMLATGSLLHNSISMYLSGIPEPKLPLAGAVKGYWASLKDFLPEVKDVRFLEERISHEFLCYRGVADCFGRYRDSFVVIDWKTSRKLKPTLHSTFDSPLQVAAYVGALNFDKNWSYLANTGLIAIAYENGNTATIHYMDKETLQRYWNQWLQRLKSYWENIDVSAS